MASGDVPADVDVVTTAGHNKEIQEIPDVIVMALNKLAPQATTY